MQYVYLQYPCGMKLEAKTYSIITFLFSVLVLTNKKDDGGNLCCPIHGVNCPKSRK
jgi:hypothetical protein